MAPRIHTSSCRVWFLDIIKQLLQLSQWVGVRICIKILKYIHCCYFPIWANKFRTSSTEGPFHPALSQSVWIFFSFLKYSFLSRISTKYCFHYMIMGTIFSYCSSASTFFIQIHKIHPSDSVSVTTDFEPLGIDVGARVTQPFPTFPTLESGVEPIASLPTFFFYYKFCFYNDISSPIGKTSKKSRQSGMNHNMPRKGPDLILLNFTCPVYRLISLWRTLVLWICQRNSITRRARGSWAKWTDQKVAIQMLLSSTTEKYLDSSKVIGNPYTLRFNHWREA